MPNGTLPPDDGRVSEEKLVHLKGWIKGINNVHKELSQPPDSVREAINVDVDRDGIFSRRKGWTKVYDGTNCHSGASVAGKPVFVENGVLKLFEISGYTATTLREGLQKHKPVSYTDVNGKIHYSNGQETGVINEDDSAFDWGVRVPAQPALASAAGTLAAGTYLVSLSFVSETGEYGGAANPQVITLSSAGAIAVSSIDQPDDAGTIRVHVSRKDAEILYHYETLAKGVTSTTITGTNKLGAQLKTLFSEPPPAGTIVRYYRGRVYIVSGKVLYYTDPLRYGLYRPTENFVMFPKDITIMEPVIDGLYVVSGSNTYFLSGTSPEKFSRTISYPYGAVIGTGLQVPPKDWGLEEASELVAAWYGEKGLVLGLPSGVTRPIMEDSVAAYRYTQGAMLLMHEDGIKRIVAAVTGVAGTDRLGAGDYCTATVIRNGRVV